MNQDDALKLIALNRNRFSTLNPSQNQVMFTPREGIRPTTAPIDEPIPDTPSSPVAVATSIKNPSLATNQGIINSEPVPGSNPAPQGIKPSAPPKVSKNTGTTSTTKNLDLNTFQSQLDTVGKLPIVKELTDENDANKKYLQDLENQIPPQGKDYSALAAFAEQFLGQKGATKAYTPPPSRSDAMLKMLAYRDKLADNKAGLFKSLYTPLLAANTGTTSDKSNMNITIGGHDSGPKPGDANKFLDQYRKDSKTYMDSNSEIGNAGALLNSGTPVGDTAFKNTLAKALIHQRVTNQEIAAYAGRPDIASRLQQTYETMKTGRMTEANRQDMQRILDLIKAKNDLSISGLKDNYINSRAPNLGVTSEAARNMLDVKEPSLADVQAKAQPPGTPVGTVENGYRFKGGDDHKQENWEKVQ